MKLSIFTPTHDTKFLLDLWETIKDQPTDWEWVIVYNGNATIPDELSDKRIRNLRFPSSVESRIGQLKHFACSMSKGDILVEVDHDDLLAPNALAKIHDAFEHPDIGFVYSDFANFHDETWNKDVWDPSFGWQVYPVKFQDHVLMAHRSFNCDARALSQIQFSPNHVRAWRKSVYDSIGGHREDLAVGDDHELLCRTFLATKFHHIPECLYFYRLHADGGNSYKIRFDEVHKQVQVNRNLYLPNLVSHWADTQGLLRIDLGGAHGKPAGWKAVDKAGDVEYPADLEDAIPLPTNSVGAVRAVDFLEHIHDSVNLMNEIYRVLVPGGWLLSLTPSSEGKGAYCDPTHVSFWNDLSFRYYCNKEFSKYVPSIKCRFQEVRVFDYFPDEWHRENNVPYVCGDLVALKNGYRVPGKTFI